MEEGGQHCLTIYARMVDPSWEFNAHQRSSGMVSARFLCWCGWVWYGRSAINVWVHLRIFADHGLVVICESLSWDRALLQLGHEVPASNCACRTQMARICQYSFSRRASCHVFCCMVLREKLIWRNNKCNIINRYKKKRLVR